MPQFQLTVKRTDRALEPVVEARYGLDFEYSIPKSIAGIEAAIGRLQTDIVRDATTTRRLAQDQTSPGINAVFPEGAIPSPSGATVREMGALLFRYLFDGPIESLHLAQRRWSGSLDIATS